MENNGLAKALPIKNTELIMLSKDLNADLALEVEECWINPCSITRGNILRSGLLHH